MLSSIHQPMLLLALLMFVGLSSSLAQDLGKTEDLGARPDELLGTWEVSEIETLPIGDAYYAAEDLLAMSSIVKRKIPVRSQFTFHAESADLIMLTSQFKGLSWGIQSSADKHTLMIEQPCTDCTNKLHVEFEWRQLETGYALVLASENYQVEHFLYLSGPEISEP
jgi:hypothetical protein